MTLEELKAKLAPDPKLRDQAVQLDKLCRRSPAGLWVAFHTWYHWQINGGTFTVNYYPTKGTAYINGMTQCFRGVNLKRAVKLATELPDKSRPDLPTPRKHKRMGQDASRRMKRQLLKRDPYCYWCKKCGIHHEPLTINSATIEHVIPLSRGGSNRMDNLALSHEWCNRAHGDGRGLEMSEEEFTQLLMKHKLKSSRKVKGPFDPWTHGDQPPEKGFSQQ